MSFLSLSTRVCYTRCVVLVLLEGRGCYCKRCLSPYIILPFLWFPSHTKGGDGTISDGLHHGLPLRASHLWVHHWVLHTRIHQPDSLHLWDQDQHCALRDCVP